MSSVVLDASAVLAFVLEEKGSDVVESRMNGALMSAVNYSEVLKKSIERGGSAGVTRVLISRAQIEVVPFDEPQATVAAALFSTTRDKGLSFADRACLALGIEMNAVVYTADQRLADSGATVEVKLIRQRTKQKARPQ